MIRTGALLIGLAVPAESLAADLVFDVLDQVGWSCQSNSRRSICIMPPFIEALSHRSGVKITMQKMPVPRILDRLKRHQATFALSPTIEPGLAPVGESFSIPLMAVGRKGGVPLNRYEDLYALKSVGFLRSARYDHQIDNDPLVPRIELPETSTALKMLAAGRLDAVVSSALAIAAQAREEDLESALGSRLVLGQLSFYVMTASDRLNEPAIQDVGRALSELRADGTLERMLFDTVGFSLTQ